MQIARLGTKDVTEEPARETRDLSEAVATYKARCPKNRQATDIDGELLERIVIDLEAAFLQHSRLIKTVVKLIDEHRHVLLEIADRIDKDRGVENVDAGPLVRAVMEKWIAYAVVECGAAVRIYNRVRDIEDPDVQTKMILQEVEFFTIMKTMERPR